MRDKRRAPAPPGSTKAPVTVEQEEPIEMSAPERAFREQVWAACGHTDEIPTKELKRPLTIKPIEVLGEFEGGRSQVGVTVMIQGLGLSGAFRVYYRNGLTDAVVYPGWRSVKDRLGSWAIGNHIPKGDPLRQALLDLVREREAE